VKSPQRHGHVSLSRSTERKYDWSSKLSLCISSQPECSLSSLRRIVGARANGQPASILKPQHKTNSSRLQNQRHLGLTPTPPANITQAKALHSQNSSTQSNQSFRKIAKEKIPGSCVVGLTVDIDGNPKDVHVVSSMPGFEDKKLRAAVIELQDSCTKPVKQYRFEPGTFQGKPVPVELKVEINFQFISPPFGDLPKFCIAHNHRIRHQTRHRPHANNMRN
jgi:TonB-like protein